MTVRNAEALLQAAQRAIKKTRDAINGASIPRDDVIQQRVALHEKAAEAAAEVAARERKVADLVTRLAVDAAAADELRVERSAIAEAKQREQDLRAAAATLNPRVEALSAPLRALHERLRHLESQPALIELHEAGADIETALAEIEETLIPRWHAARREYERVRGDRSSLPSADLLLVRTVQLWSRGMIGIHGTPLIMPREMFPPNTQGLSVGIPAPNVPSDDE